MVETGPPLILAHLQCSFSNLRKELSDCLASPRMLGCGLVAAKAPLPRDWLKCLCPPSAVSLRIHTNSNNSLVCRAIPLGCRTSSRSSDQGQPFVRFVSLHFACSCTTADPGIPMKQGLSRCVASLCRI